MESKKKTDKFRACVGALIINKKGQILAFQRSDQTHIWQAPQGGLEIGEAPYEAILREVYEETYIKERCLSLLREHPDWLSYELPSHLRNERFGIGQTQKWFLFRFEGTNQDIQLKKASSHEFISYQWIYFEELKPLLSPFKQRVYVQLYQQFEAYLNT